MAELVISTGSGECLLRVDLTDRSRVTIGQSDKCDVRLTGPGVSRHHALLFKEAGRWFILDLSASKGLFAGEQRVKTATATEQTPIRIGEAYLWFFDMPNPDVRELPALRVARRNRVMLRHEYLEELWLDGTISETDYQAAVA